MSEHPEETIVGRHESGIVLQEGMNTSTGNNYCSKCRKNIHCHVKIDENGNPEVKYTCSDNDCVCKCRTHYPCKICGRLHPYTTECDYVETEHTYDPKNDEEFRKMILEWRKEVDSKKEKIPEKKTE